LILKKIVITIVLLAAIVVLIVVVEYFSTYVFPWHRESAIKATIEIGGLSKLPYDLNNLEIEKYGGMFTRQFIIKFHSSKEEIQNWINKSKRLKSATPKSNGLKKTYEIYPGENGTFGGKVEIQGNDVLIDMSSS